MLGPGFVKGREVGQLKRIYQSLLFSSLANHFELGALLHQIVGGHQTQKRPNAEAEFRGDLLLKLVRPICTRKVLWINQMIAA